MSITLKDNVRVLIVEDEPIIVKSLENRLVKAGYSIAGSAASGEDAVRLARQECPDLILMDINLVGVMTGIEAAEEIKKFLNVPIVYLTSYNDEVTFQKAKDTNPFAYLSKPFDGEQLQRVIELTLTNYRITNQLEQTRQRYEIALEAGNTAVWELQVDKSELSYDRNLRTLFGYEYNELSNKLDEWYYLVHPEDLSFVQEVVSAMSSGKQSDYGLEYRIIRKNRTVGWVYTQINLLRNDDGTPERLIGATTDITERKLSEQALKKSEEKFRRTFESAGIGMAIVAPDGRFTKVNNTLCNMMQYSSKEFLQFYLDDISLMDDYLNVKRIVDQLLENKLAGPQQIEFRLKNKNGDILWSATSLSLVKDFKNKPLYFIVIFQNISERKNAEEKLKEYAEELQLSNTAKDKFFSIISHDLRNPFHTILGASEFLSMYSEDLTLDELKETSGNIHNAARNVYNLLINLLEWSRVQTGKLEVCKEKLDVNELFENVLLLYSEIAAHKNISIINELSEPLSVFADKYMIESVLRNLVSNAVKFTIKGGKVVLFAEGIGDFTHITVNDNGIGITEEDQKKLFKYDQQYSAKGTSNEGGTGLGLAICKEFVEKNCGQISVESKKGSGSTFKIILPAIDN